MTVGSILHPASGGLGYYQCTLMVLDVSQGHMQTFITQDIKKNIFSGWRPCKPSNFLQNPLRSINNVLRARIHFYSILLTNLFPSKRDRKNIWSVVVSKCWFPSACSKTLYGCRTLWMLVAHWVWLQGGAYQAKVLCIPRVLLSCLITQSKDCGRLQSSKAKNL